MLVKLMDEKASNGPFELLVVVKKVDFHREAPDPDTKEGGGGVATVWHGDAGCSYHPFQYAAYVLNDAGKTIDTFFA